MTRAQLEAVVARLRGSIRQQNERCYRLGLLPFMEYRGFHMRKKLRALETRLKETP